MASDTSAAIKRQSSGMIVLLSAGDSKLTCSVILPSKLGFFSLPKGGARAHLVLRILDRGELLKAHWSIRQQRFFKGAYNIVPACDPRTDYAAALIEGRLGSP